MNVAKYVCGAAMALALTLALSAVQPVKADDGVPEGRVAVTYEYQVDWSYPPTGQTYHTGYTVTVWWDNGAVVQKRGYDEAMAEYQSSLDAGWQITATNGPSVVGVTPW